MSVETDTLSGGTGESFGSRYDWLLAAIPVPLLLGWGVGAAASVPDAVAVGVGSLLAATLVAYGLFVDAPSVRTAGGSSRIASGDD